MFQMKFLCSLQLNTKNKHCTGDHKYDEFFERSVRRCLRSKQDEIWSMSHEGLNLWLSPTSLPLSGLESPLPVSGTLVALGAFESTTVQGLHFSLLSSPFTL